MTEKEPEMQKKIEAGFAITVRKQHDIQAIDVTVRRKINLFWQKHPFPPRLIVLSPWMVSLLSISLETIYKTENGKTELMFYGLKVEESETIMTFEDILVL